MARLSKSLLGGLANPAMLPAVQESFEKLGGAPRKSQRQRMFTEAMESGDPTNLNELLLSDAARSGDPLAMAKTLQTTQALTQSATQRSIYNLELQRSQAYTSGNFVLAAQIEKQMAEAAASGGIDPKGIMGRTSAQRSAAIKQETEDLNNQITLVKNELFTVVNNHGINSDEYKAAVQQFNDADMGMAVQEFSEAYTTYMENVQKQQELTRNNTPLSQEERQYLLNLGATEDSIDARSISGQRALLTSLQRKELEAALTGRSPLTTKAQARGHVDFALSQLAAKYDYISFFHDDLREVVEEQVLADTPEAKQLQEEIYSLVLGSRPNEVATKVEEWMSTRFKKEFDRSKSAYERRQTRSALIDEMVVAQARHRKMITEDQGIQDLTEVQRRVLLNEVTDSLAPEIKNTLIDRSSVYDLPLYQD